MKKLLESICNDVAENRGQYIKTFNVLVLHKVSVNLESLDNFEYLGSGSEIFSEHSSCEDILKDIGFTKEVIESITKPELDLELQIYKHDLTDDMIIIETNHDNVLRKLVKILAYNLIDTCVVIPVVDESNICYEFKVVDCRSATERFIDSEGFLIVSPKFGSNDDDRLKDTIKTTCIGSRYLQNITIPEDIKYVVDKVIKEKDYESAATCITSVTCDILTAKAANSIKKYVRDELGDTAGNICDMLLNFKK